MNWLGDKVKAAFNWLVVDPFNAGAAAADVLKGGVSLAPSSTTRAAVDAITGASSSSTSSPAPKPTGIIEQATGLFETLIILIVVGGAVYFGVKLTRSS